MNVEDEIHKIKTTQRELVDSFRVLLDTVNELAKVVKIKKPTIREVKNR